MVSSFGDAEDYAARQSLEFLSGYRAQGHGYAPGADRSLTPLRKRSCCTGSFFPSSTIPSKTSITCTAAPRSDRGAAELPLEAFLPTLQVIYLLIGSESHSIHTLPSCPYAVAASSSLLPNQALSRFYQHPLNKSVSPWPPQCFPSSPLALSAAQIHLTVRMGAEWAPPLLCDNLRLHMLGTSWYLSTAERDGASQEPHCEPKLCHEQLKASAKTQAPQ